VLLMKRNRSQKSRASVPFSRPPIAAFMMWTVYEKLEDYFICIHEKRVNSNGLGIKQVRT
jgi:hypothetical protein